MASSLPYLPFCLVLVCGAAIADGSGTFYNEGKPIELTHAYAFRAADPFDEGSRITTITFADRAIDTAALADAGDRADALEAQLRDATRVDLNLMDDGSVQNVNIRTAGQSGSQSGSGWYTLTLRHNNDKRVEGRFISNDEEDKANGRWYDLRFALDLQPVPDPGVALPAGGGEAGEAYLAYQAALKNGDVDALARTMSKARAEELLAHRNDADFKLMFAFIQGQAMQDAKYVKGHAKGDRATLDFAGKDGDGNAATSSVTMLREGGAWKVQKESMSTRVQ